MSKRCEESRGQLETPSGSDFQRSWTSTISRIPVTAKYFSQIGQIMTEVYVRPSLSTPCFPSTPRTFDDQSAMGVGTPFICHFVSL